jgi:hypothetical protein
MPVTTKMSVRTRPIGFLRCAYSSLEFAGQEKVGRDDGGYLRRDPNTAPDSDLSGYDFWLHKLNQFGGNYVAAEMVKAFTVSSEYRQRFGQ